MIRAACNGRPKIVQIGGWKTGVMASRLILHSAERGIEVYPHVRLTAGQWDRKGLDDAALDAARAEVRRLELEALEVA